MTEPGTLRRNAGQCLLGLVLATTAMVSAAEETQITDFVGKAYDTESGELLYTEEHRLEQAEGVPQRETVHYVTPGGDTLAEKEMTYWQPERPGYRLTITQPERTETVDPGDDGVAIESKESGTLEWSEDNPSVIDGGFHYFILNHFDQLLAGDSVDFQFLAPSRVRWLGLRVEPAGQADGQLRLDLKVQSTILSWVVSDIELTYDIDTRQLLRYRGLTNLPDPDGGNYTADIKYQYPETNPP
ncbi:MAG TPA: hypothetical protein VFN16_01240 [Saccharospirillum sp.]|nr:hypothetical protein [Saccharospirillum sp.]